MPSRRTAAMSQSGNQYGELPARITGAMREEPIIVAARATRADRYFANATKASVIGNERAEVEGRCPVDGATCQPLEDIRTDFIAVTADRGTEMHHELCRRHSSGFKQIERAFDDAGCGSAPARVQERGGTRGVREEYRNAVRDRHRHRGSSLEREVSVGVAAAEPSHPRRPVHEHAVSVHLARGCEPWTEWREMIAEAVPARDDVAHRLVAREPEAARCPR